MKRAFTLIELLIVVAIIAILAAIAVPNFLEAQTRSKVSRAMADLRSLATALESYRVDNNAYPIDGGNTPDGYAFWYIVDGPRHVGGTAGITSPIAYISNYSFTDPFRRTQEANTSRLSDADGTFYTDDDYRRYRYRLPSYTYGFPGSESVLADLTTAYGQWVMNSSGPDHSYGPSYTPSAPFLGNTLNVVYDPTNGTVSLGDILRTQKDPSGKIVYP